MKVKGAHEQREKRGKSKKRRWLRRLEKDRKEKQYQWKREEGERRRAPGECREEETRNRMCEDRDVSNGHMSWWRGSWWIRVDDGPTLRTAKGRRRMWRAATRAAAEDEGKKWREREWDQKVEREHVALCFALAEQCNRNNGHHSSSTSSSRSLAHAVTYVSRSGEARRPRCQDQVLCS